MTRDTYEQLSRRERQIMDVVFRLGRASVGEVREQLPDPPSYSAVRATMGILERKGHLTHEREGTKFVYSAVASQKRVRRRAMGKLLDTFFDGSPEKALAALLSRERPDDEQLERMRKLIDEAREQGR